MPDKSQGPLRVKMTFQPTIQLLPSRYEQFFGWGQGKGGNVPKILKYKALQNVLFTINLRFKNPPKRNQNEKNILSGHTAPKT